MGEWESILSADGPAVWRVARRLLGNDADADECFQEAFMDGLKFSRRGQVLNWRALLIRLATARAIDRLRRRNRDRSRQQSVDWENIRQADPLPADRAQAVELSQQLREALAKIPSQQARIFCLVCLDGWSYREVAEQLAISENSVGVQIHRAKKRLRELMFWMTEVTS